MANLSKSFVTKIESKINIKKFLQLFKKVKKGGDKECMKWEVKKRQALADLEVDILQKSL